jgi:hypothetical protein
MEKSYQVANHIFTFNIEDSSPLWKYIDRAYSPFFVEGVNSSIFSIRMVDTVCSNDSKLLYVDDNPEPGFVRIAVYEAEEGYYMEFTQYESDSVNGRLYLRHTGEAEVSLHGEFMLQWMTFTNIAQVCYFIRTSTLDTLMVHASAIYYKERAYLFLGKSGTGKSTHSRMWLEGIPGAELMNDDHPILRVLEDGTPMAFGSPWSGKTHCYRNIQAPVSAIVRIKQEKVNAVRRLRPVESFGSLMSSCSGFPIDKRFSDGKGDALQKVIKSAPCWELGCLPNVDAALVCSEAVVEN